MKRILTRIAIVMLTVLMCASGLSVQVKADSNDKVEDLYIGDVVVAVGKEKWIEYSIYPGEYYEDVSLVWTSGDESIVKVDQNGYVTGVKPGVTTITVGLKGRPELDVTALAVVTEGVGCAILQDNGDLIFFRSNDEENDYTNEMTDLNGKVYKGKRLFYDVEDYMFNFCWIDDETRESIIKAYVAEGNTMYLVDLQNYFCRCTNLVEADLRGFNTEYCRRYAHMFAECESLEKVDLSTFVFAEDASYTYNMFGKCNKLAEIVIGTEIYNTNVLGNFPSGKWSHGSYSLLAEELASQYRSNSAQWAGNWTRNFVSATSIAFKQKEYTVECPNIGIELEYELIVTPDDATPVLEWESSDWDIAEVYNEGTVVGLTPGDVIITVRTTEEPILTATCTVHVIERPEVTGFKFITKEYKVAENGGGAGLDYEITPENAHVNDLIWESSDDTICKAYPGYVIGVKQGKVTITVKSADGKVYDTCTVEVVERVNYAYRVFGSNRFKTSLEIATVFCEWFGDETVDNVVLAYSHNFADALAGSYLAAVKNAPIIIINDDNIDLVKKYLTKYFDKRGTIYILGGPVAVSEKIETEMKKITKNVTRLAGSNRYGTNLEILKEAGMNRDAILVATGTNFADSLSASATGYPMLLVKDVLTAEQKEFLRKNKGKKIYILGGEMAVSKAVEKELSAYGTVERIAGASRFETSVMIAKKFFPSTWGGVMIAYSHEYPDGLCGGPLAYRSGEPLILTRPGNLDLARKYIKENNIYYLDVLGGASRLSDADIKKLLGNTPTEIIKYEYGK